MGIQERKEREKGHRREEILAAAQKVFFEKGLQNSTMDEIAEAAELSKGTLYLYYKSKEDLYLAVSMKGHEVLYKMFQQSLSGAANSIVAVQLLGDTYYRFYREHRNFFQMMQFADRPQFHKQVSDEMREECTRVNQSTWQFANQVVQRGMDEGLIRSDLPASEITLVLWSASNAILFRMDHEQEFWKTQFNIELGELLVKSHRLLLDAIMTDKAKALIHKSVS